MYHLITYAGHVVHGLWSSWIVDDSVCTSSSCDANMSRLRTCTDPAPSPGGQSCPDGDAQEDGDSCGTHEACTSGIV